MRQNWLGINNAVSDLHLYDNHINEIKNGAFVSEAFETLETLEISKMSLEYLNNRTFDGLSNLNYLRFDDVKIIKLNANILIQLGHLEMFSMQYFHSEPLYLDNFFGMQNVLPRLYNVNIESCNLSATITEKTFTGLHSVQTLRLDKNGIQQIGERSFDVPLKTLNHLALKNNKMTWIPSNIFKVKVGKALIVVLDQNPWNCDCKLEHLRKFIQTQKKVDLNLLRCVNPLRYKGHYISALPDLCNELPIPESPPNTLTTKKPEPNQNNANHEFPLQGFSAVTTHPEFDFNMANLGDKNPISSESYGDGKSDDDDVNVITLWCNTSNSTKHTENFIFKQTLPTIRLNDTQHLIDTEEPTNDFKLLGFEQMPGNNAKCFTNVKNNETIKMGANKIYRFCWIQNGSKTISMLDCTTVVSNITEDLSVWITMEHKPMYLVVWIFAAIFGFAIGILIGILLIKLCFIVFPGKLSDSGMEETAKDISIYAEINKVTKSTTNIHPVFGENEVLGRFFISEDAPPLPPRNKKIHLEQFKCCNSEQCECYCEL